MKNTLGFVFVATVALAFAAMGVASAQDSAGVLVRSDGIYIRCDQCGKVERIEQNIGRGGSHGTAGAVIGAIAGGVLGNQIGKGKGRALATAGGAVGGGLAGNAIGKSGSRQTWTLRIRMGNGRIVNVEVPDASAIRVGDLVEVEPNGNITRLR